MNDQIKNGVIAFTANYCGRPEESIEVVTTLASLGVEGIELTNYTMEIEDSFDIIYADEDENKLITVSDVIELIKKKLGE